MRGLSLFLSSVVLFVCLHVTTSVASVLHYDAYDEFSGVPGGTTGVWSYQYEQGGIYPMTWVLATAPCWIGDGPWEVHNGEVWCGPQGPGALWCNPAIAKPNSGQVDGRPALVCHPGRIGDYQIGYNTVLTWTALAPSPSVTVRLTCQKVNGGDGNGVLIEIRKNSTVVASVTIPAGDFNPRTLTPTVSVSTGDAIRFVVNSLGSAYYDEVGFNMSVEYGQAPQPADVVYTGPTFLTGVESCIRDETDQRISEGDNVQMDLAFQNTGDVAAPDVVVSVGGRYQNPNRPAITFSYWDQSAQPPAWSPFLPYHQNMDIGQISPGHLGFLHLRMYVDRVDPRYLAEWYIVPDHPQFDIGVVTPPGSAGRITVAVQPLAEFPPTGLESMVSTDCLHSPAAPSIRRYAQFAAGNPLPDHPAGADPDSPLGIARNILVQMRQGDPSQQDFPVGLDGPRVPDVELLNRRFHPLGKCSHYADLVIGLLRSVGIPTRYLTGKFGVDGNHSWTEAYFSSDWHNVDAAQVVLDNKSYYRTQWEEPWWVFASSRPLSNILTWTLPRPCNVYCSEPTMQCQSCNDWARDNPVDCFTDVTSTYATAKRRELNGPLMVAVDGPASVTEGEQFAAHVRIRNDGQDTAIGIEVRVDTRLFAGDTLDAYSVEPSQWTLDSLGVGEEVVLDATVVPLLPGFPLGFMAAAVIGGDEGGAGGLLQRVNQVGTLPDLTVVGTVGPDVVEPGGQVVLECRVLDDALQPTQEATVDWTLAARHGGYEASGALIYSVGDSAYTANISLPSDAPIGEYEAEIVGNRGGFEPDTTSTVIIIRPALTLSATATPGVVSVEDTLTVNATVVAGGAGVDSASVVAVFKVGEHDLTIPMGGIGGGAYRTRLQPRVFAANLGGGVLPAGQWSVSSRASWFGGTAEDSTMVEVHAPDLEVSGDSLTLDTRSPEPGDTVTVSARVVNQGTAVARMVRVRFMLDAPDSSGTQIGDDRIAAYIQAGGDQVLGVLWDTHGISGQHTIWAVIDPLEELVETNKANNRASTIVPVEPSAVNEGGGAKIYSISQNRPNPFAAGTVIEYRLPAATAVNLEVYDVGGRLVRTLVKSDMPAGNHNVVWDGADTNGKRLAQGTYIVRLKAGAFEDNKKVVLLR